MRRGMRARSLAAFLGLLVAATTAGAETVYVTDRFEIGIHESTELDSVIVAVVPSGTPLKVVGRREGLVQVATEDGIRGWVDVRYVITEKPGVALLEDRDAKLLEAVRSLGDARAEVEVLRQRVSELQRDAATAAHSSSAATKPVALESGEDAARLAEAEREIQALTRENRVLEATVADLRAANAALEQTEVEEPEPEEESGNDVFRGVAGGGVRSWTPWEWLLFGSVLLLAFAAGGYAVDWESRRRHGGFRV